MEFQRYEDSESIPGYSILFPINYGTYSVVYEAFDINKKTDRVALKRIDVAAISKKRVCAMFVNERDILSTLNHENVVKLVSSYVSDAVGMYCLILEFCDCDLRRILRKRDGNTMPPIITKTMMLQLMAGLQFIHSRGIVHRDLKPSNILISRSPHSVATVKLSDFRLAKDIRKNPNDKSIRVVTLNYRAPELLLGDTNYGTAIDIWSAGCIMAELWQPERPLFAECSTIDDMLYRIAEICGPIGPRVWPDIVNLEEYKRRGGCSITADNSRSSRPLSLMKLMKVCPDMRSKYGYDFFEHLTDINPQERFSASIALGHEYFSRDPLPLSTLVF